jgi:hypothetical protein
MKRRFMHTFRERFRSYKIEQVFFCHESGYLVSFHGRGDLKKDMVLSTRNIRFPDAPLLLVSAWVTCCIMLAFEADPFR